MKKSKIFIAFALIGSAHALMALSDEEVRQLHSKFTRAVEAGQFDQAQQYINRLTPAEADGRAIWQRILQNAKATYATAMQPAAATPSPEAMPLPPRIRPMEIEEAPRARMATDIQNVLQGSKNISPSFEGESANNIVMSFMTHDLPRMQYYIAQLERRNAISQALWAYFWILLSKKA